MQGLPEQLRALALVTAEALDRGLTFSRGFRVVRASRAVDRGHEEKQYGMTYMYGVHISN